MLMNRQTCGVIIIAAALGVLSALSWSVAQTETDAPTTQTAEPQIYLVERPDGDGVPMSEAVEQVRVISDAALQDMRADIARNHTLLKQIKSQHQSVLMSLALLHEQVKQLQDRSISHGDLDTNLQQIRVELHELHEQIDTHMQPSEAPEAQEAQQAAAPLNPNTAPIEDLLELDGVGPAIAQRIINYREAAKPPAFALVDDLTRVRGISARMANEWHAAGHLTFESPATQPAQ